MINYDRERKLELYNGMDCHKRKFDIDDDEEEGVLILNSITNRPDSTSMCNSFRNFKIVFPKLYFLD
jgi:hypothetical protein